MSAEDDAMNARARNMRNADRSLPFTPLTWPLVMTAAAAEAGAAFLTHLTRTLADQDAPKAPEPEWTTENKVALTLPSMRLRDFSLRPEELPTLICAPYALHGATIADFASGHSIVEALRRSGCSRVFVADWLSATPQMRFLSIDNYLADLNVAVDELGPPVDLVGLCQGGWLSLLYAARFPAKIRRLVLVGAPVDFHAGQSLLSNIVASAPTSVFENLVQLGKGRVLGSHVLEAWAPIPGATEAHKILQVTPACATRAARELEARFYAWYAWTVDLPGSYYLETIERLYRQNQIACGQFIALGRQVDLTHIRAPIFLLAARDDELVAPEQLFAVARLVGSAEGTVEMLTEPCGHLGLFLGARTMAGSWRKIGHWLSDG